ncbi:hypothetical protein CDAR_313871 [Caerostris darwini]|uniref:Uncharacterized protein n=1 Tax=Caerostris darwini TaxID=1538125 RepID=A0AAV4QHY1_9ARAC|nr:hypothetical protein CDAR_313871 [Caerostris darwini]
MLNGPELKMDDIPTTDVATENDKNDLKCLPYFISSIFFLNGIVFSLQKRDGGGGLRDGSKRILFDYVGNVISTVDGAAVDPFISETFL